MSVPKSKKKESLALYLSNATLLNQVTYSYCKRFPKEIRKIKINKLIEIASNIEYKCKIINSIYLTKSTNDIQVNLRETSLLEAISLCIALREEVSSLHKSIKDKVLPNPYKTYHDLTRKFIRWVNIISLELKYLKNLLKFDNSKLKEESTNKY